MKEPLPLVDPRQPTPPRASEGTRLSRLGDQDSLLGLSIEASDLAGQLSVELDVDRCRFRGVSLAGSRLDRLRLVDVSFETCDLAGVVLTAASMTRVRFAGCRLTGLVLDGGTLLDVHFSACSGKAMALVEVTGRRVRFDDTDLTAADLRRTRLDDAAFVRSDITGADLGHAAIAARFEETRALALHGVAGLKGSTLDRTALLDVAPELAAALGMTTNLGVA